MSHNSDTPRTFRLVDIAIHTCQSEMGKFYIGFIVLLILNLNGIDQVVGRSKSSELLEELLEDYGPPTVRPVEDESTVTTVVMRLLVTQIIALEERDQTLVVSGWLKWNWIDENLRWNQRNDTDVAKLHVPIDQIWMPDIVLFTNVDTGFEAYKLKEVTVFPNGEVNYASPTILTFSCIINARIFPFDWQVCNMTFSSWNYHMGELDLLPSNRSDSSQNKFAENGVWELKKIKIWSHDNEYLNPADDKCSHCYTKYRELNYSLFMKRRPTAHVLSLIIPCLLLSILNLLVYLLPPEAGEKIGLGMTNLLALVLFQTLVSQTLPPTASPRTTPIISFYFTPMIGLTCISIVNAVVVLKLFYYGRQNRPIPKWMRTVLVKCLAPIMFYEMIAYEDDPGQTTADEPVESEGGSEKQEKGENDINMMKGSELPRSYFSISRFQQMAAIRYDGFAVEDNDAAKDPAILKGHRMTDWQNVALIWDKFVMILMTILTGLALAIVFFLYVAEINQNTIDFGGDDGMAVGNEE